MKLFGGTKDDPLFPVGLDVVGEFCQLKIHPKTGKLSGPAAKYLKPAKVKVAS